MNNIENLTKMENMDVLPAAKRIQIQKFESIKNGQTTDIHIKNLPLVAWRIAKGAATIEGIPIAIWVAQAILEKWERRENSKEIHTRN